jgi:hypothetical protein
MELIPIILAIIAITLFYFLYSYYSVKPVSLSATADLSKSNPTIEINSSHSRYAYGIWVYVNNFPATNKTLFKRNNNIELTFNGRSTLTCKLSTTHVDVVSVDITDNFPIQKWTHIAVNVDNSYTDCYIDGKLVKSKNMSDANGPPLRSVKTNGVILGSSIDAHIAKFQYWDHIVNPEDVWSEYMAGNGQSQIMKSLSSYGADITILKDGIKLNEFAI